MKFRLPFVVIALLLGLATSLVRADLKLPPLISDHMVLQADAPVPIWGWADPGQKVSVQFGGQAKQTTADNDGHWRITLDPMKAGAAGTMQVVCDKAAPKLINDVLVGEVWLCSGQSNMEAYMYALTGADQIMPQCDLPQMRLFKVDKQLTPEPMPQVNGRWVRSDPKTVAMFSGIGILFGRDLHNELKAPVGMIQATWGGTRIKNWVSSKTLESDPLFAPIIESGRALGPGAADFAQFRAMEEAAKKDPSAPKVARVMDWPSRIYNGMIDPVMPYRIRGILWYQGESDAYDAKPYGPLFRAMIRDWRTKWDHPDLPVIFVQLPGYKKSLDYQPAKDFWSELREAQLQVLDMPHVHMIVTTDIGEENIHPQNKLEVSRRLFQIAMANVYSKSNAITYPRVQNAVFDHSKVIVTFLSTTHTIRTVDAKPVRGFALAGEDRKWHWADATISANTVIVTSAQVPKPIAVRYNYVEQTTSFGNLADGNGLPAAPFRSDKW